MADQLQAQVNNIINRLKDSYHPQKIILYGSVVSGKTHKWSDIDLVLIKKTNKRFYDRIGEVLNLIYSDNENSPEVGVDVLVYTPSEYQDMKSYNYFIRDEVDKKGKIVYEHN